LRPPQGYERFFGHGDVRDSTPSRCRQRGLVGIAFARVTSP
jgi:hypothetical protein